MCCVFPWLAVSSCVSPAAGTSPSGGWRGVCRMHRLQSNGSVTVLQHLLPFFPPLLPLCICFRHSVFSGQTAEGFLCSQGARWQGSRKSRLYCHRLKQLLLSATSQPWPCRGHRARTGFHFIIATGGRGENGSNSNPSQQAQKCLH